MPKYPISPKVTEGGSITSYFRKATAPFAKANKSNTNQSHNTKDATDNITALKWIQHETLLKTRYQCPFQTDVNIKTLDSITNQAPTTLAVAAFDLDSTLVDTKSRTPFPRNGSDWKWNSHNVKPVLLSISSTLASTQPPEQATVKHLSPDTKYLIVIFSNQGGVVPKPDTKRYAYLCDRVSQIANDLKAPFWFYAATKESGTKKSTSTSTKSSTVSYRKPAPGMWMHFVAELENEGYTVDYQKSFFVGDAAGRKSDFSDSDKKFASAVGLNFLTPEEFFNA